MRISVPLSRVTASQVARACGVSQPTVSRILSNGPSAERYSPDTRQRVLGTARRLGYRLNAAARSTRTGRFEAVGLMLSTHHSRSILPGAMLGALSDALAARGQRLSIDKLPDDKLVDENMVPDLLRGWSVDGLLINYNTDIPDNLIRLIDAYGVPSVWLNSKQAHDCVYPDDEQAGRIATEHLLELGHRRIAFVHYGGWSHYSTPARRDGYVQAMRAAGLEPELVTAPDMSPADRRRTAAQWLRQPDRPTAVVVYGEATLWPLNLAAQIDVGLSVPRDLSFVSFAHTSLMHGDIHVSSARLPNESMARRAVDLLLERVDDPTVTHPPACLPCRLEVGNTSAPPAG